MKADFGVVVAGAREILDLPISKRFARPSLQYLSAYFMKFKSDKAGKSTICNWERPVTQRQMLYAATDAYCSYLVWKHISQVNFPRNFLEFSLNLSILITICAFV